MERRRIRAAAVATLALVAGLLATGHDSSVAADRTPAPKGGGSLHKATLPAGFVDTTAIGGISEPVSVAFAPDGTAFLALKTGQIKSYDYDAASGRFEAAATSTDFADLSEEVSNYGDRGLTGITVDPQFPARPYVYVDYTYDVDPANPGAVPPWHVVGRADDHCGPDDIDEARIPKDADDPDQTYKRGCPGMDRVSRLTAQKSALGWTLAPSGEHVLVQDGCVQFSSHSSGDVAFGPDGKLYASAGDGASFLNNDYGQANAHGYAAACPGDPTNEGGSLRAQDQRGTTSGDALGIDGTIYRLDPDAGLMPSQAPADQWLVAMGQRNPWRFTFRQGKEQLWSVDVGSSNYEEINQLVDAPHTSLANRGWPCYEGGTGASKVNPNWASFNESPICQVLYAAEPGAVQAPVFAYPTTNADRTATVPLTPGENCPAVSSSISGIAFSALGTTWPAADQDALFFSDYLRGCIWMIQKDANGQPDPSRVQLFVQGAGAPVKLTVGPGGDLYYVDYGAYGTSGYAAGSGGLHRISYAGATPLTVKSSPKKVKIKVDGKRRRAPYRTALASGTVVKLVAPKVYLNHGVRYLFKQWKGVSGKKAKKKRKLTLSIGDEAVAVKAVYKRVRRHR
jgi:glucose/arabinose dehydrogenase